MSSPYKAALSEAACPFAVRLSDEAIDQLTAFVATLLHWRTRTSLTTAATAQQIIEEHIADSFALGPHIPTGSHLADIGSGAGFPGVPIAMARSDVQVVLVEARRKRASFLREILRQSSISNASVLEARAESLEPENTRIDVITSRAFGTVASFLEIARALLPDGGVALAMKGPRGSLEATPYPGFGEPEIFEYALPRHGQRLLLRYTRAR